MIEAPNSTTGLNECPICLKDSTNAVRIACGHIFCFKCIKASTESCHQCPLCRRQINDGFFVLEHELIGPLKLPSRTRDGKYWFYSGYKGWWLCDHDVARHLEDQFNAGQATTTMWIAGRNYILDLVSMTQRAEGEPDSRVRILKRSAIDDLENIWGIGGLKLTDFESILNMMKDH